MPTRSDTESCASTARAQDLVGAGKLGHGLPDINLQRVDGGEINPCAFVGHELVVFFCPADAAAAAREIEDYSIHAEAFVRAGTWLLGVMAAGTATQAPCCREGLHITFAEDRDGSGWTAFESLWEPFARTEESAGGTFLFARGGCLVKAWPGSGHAEDALMELHQSVQTGFRQT